MSIPLQRLRNQHLTRPHPGGVNDLVAWLGAVQAQEYPFAKWALALRLAAGTTSANIDQAFDDGVILRTHVLRPTWHFVSAADIRWMLALTAPHVHATLASYLRHVGLDPRLVRRSAAVIERALADRRYRTRQEIGEHLARRRMILTPQHVGFVTMYAELEGVICSGPRRGRQFTYALLAERAADARPLSRDEALAELIRRYFTSHGPATVRDFVWWSGLKTSDARRGLDIVKAASFDWEGLTYWSTAAAHGSSRRTPIHLLPIYDEYLVAYRDRQAVPHAWATAGAFRHTLVIGGQVAGTWRMEMARSEVTLEVAARRSLGDAERRSIESVARRYERFLGAPVASTIA